METRKYDKEFKENALRLAERDGVKEASEKLGIRKHAIYEWRRDERLAKCGVISGGKKLAPGETIEQAYDRVCNERDEFAEANYILKKALGFFVDR